MYTIINPHKYHHNTDAYYKQTQRDSFSIYAFIGLTALEIIHMLYFELWNSEVFSAICGLTGTITGVFVSQRA